jgi:hypothetical protein
MLASKDSQHWSLSCLWQLGPQKRLFGWINFAPPGPAHLNLSPTQYTAIPPRAPPPQVYIGHQTICTQTKAVKWNRSELGNRIKWNRIFGNWYNEECLWGDVGCTIFAVDKVSPLFVCGLFYDVLTSSFRSSSYFSSLALEPVFGPWPPRYPYFNLLSSLLLLSISYLEPKSISNYLFRLNPLRTKLNLFYIKTQSVPRSKHLPSRL